jgi:hypothetical protein
MGQLDLAISPNSESSTLSFSTKEPYCGAHVRNEENKLEATYNIDPVAEKKLIRKLDLRLIPWVSLLYLISFLDRTNIGNAKIQGIHQLGIHTQHYANS